MKISTPQLARNLRKYSTPHELKLWRLLRSRRFMGLKFRRQHPIGDYIIDFCCPEKKIIIELDGGGHSRTHQVREDRKRDETLKEKGWQTVRVWNYELDKNIKGVLEKIYEIAGVLHKPPHPCPLSSLGGEGLRVRRGNVISLETPREGVGEGG